MSACSLQFQQNHPFLSSFQWYFDQPLSLSNNLEDESNTAIYHNCVEVAESHEIANLLIDKLSKEECSAFLTAINFEALMKTAVIIQELKLSSITEQLGKNIVCEGCSDSCTFFKCKDKRVTMHEKRLADIGFQLYIFLTKSKLMFSDAVLGLNEKVAKEGLDYKTHWLAIERVLSKQILTIESLESQFLEKRAKKFAEKNSKKKPQTPSDKSEIRILKGVSAIKPLDPNEGLPRIASKKLLTDKDEELGEGRAEPQDRERPDKAPNSENDIKNLIDQAKDKDPGDPFVANSPIEEAFETDKLNLSQRSIQQKTDIVDMDASNELITIKNESTERKAKTSQVVKRQSDESVDVFEVAEICEKFEQKNSKAPGMQPQAAESASPPHTTDPSARSALLSEKLKTLFSAEEVELVESEYAAYLSKLSEFKSDQSFRYYEQSIRKIRLSYSSVLLKDEKFQILQNVVYYVAPNIFNYRDEATEEQITKKLLQFPPRTRKEVFLRELCLYMGNLVEYQKLYTFKELSYIVRTANILKLVNIFMIVFINCFLLFFVNLRNRQQAMDNPFLVILLYINCVICGVYSIGTPVEKLFLAKTYMTVFNSYKSRVEGEYLENTAAKEIVEHKQTYLYFYGKALKLLAFAQKVIMIPCCKYLIALIHYDNLFQFFIFYLSIYSIANKDLSSNFVSLFLILVKTSTLYRLYAHLSVQLFGVFLYIFGVLVIVYEAGVVYFIFFKDTFASDNTGSTCTDLLNCLAFSTTYGMLGAHGFAEGIESLSKESSKYYSRMFVDTGLMLVISFFTILMFLSSSSSPGFVVTNLSSKRIETGRIKRKIKEECLVCGVGKAYMEQK